MPLKLVLDSLEGVPADIAAEYVEKDGKFHIQVEGMKTDADIARVQSSLIAARSEVTGLKQKLSMLGDRKVEDVVAILERVPELEAAAAGKIDDEKINQIVEGRVKVRLAPIERERDQLKVAVGEKDKVIEGFTGKEKARTIHDQVREAAKAAGIVDSAIEDALLLADRVFELSDDGKAVVKEGSGFAAGLQPKDWMTDLQGKKPHWWGPSQGGGAGGNRAGFTTEANPWTDAHWNMTEQGKIFVKDPTRAEALAKAAGTKIGGARPAPKK